MDLLNDSAVAIAAVSAIISIGGAAWLSSRTPRSWKGACVNLVIMIVASALVAFSLGMVLNRYNAWYPTLQDLWTTPTSDEKSENAGADPSAVFSAPPSTQPKPSGDPRTLPPLPSPGERQQKFSVPTADGKQSWHAVVVLPKGYFDAANAHRDYPVLYAGHGFPGTPQQWLGSLNLPEQVDRLTDAHRLAATIIVIPDLMPNRADTECTAGPDGHTQLEDWLHRDLPGFLHAKLRTQPSRTSQAWIGFSAGGWCGVMSTMLHPDAFAAAISLGGYFRPIWEKGTPAWAKGAAGKRLDLVQLAGSSPPPVALWIQTSRRDPQTYEVTKDLMKRAKPPLSVTATITETGGHALATWAPHVEPSLAWLGRTVPGFRP